MEAIDRVYTRRPRPADGFWATWDQAEAELNQTCKRRPLSAMEIESAFLRFKKKVLGAL